MFHPVRILDNQGNIKKTVSSKKLSKDYWKTFERVGIGPNTGDKKKLKDKKKFQELLDDLTEENI